MHRTPRGFAHEHRPRPPWGHIHRVDPKAIDLLFVGCVRFDSLHLYVQGSIPSTWMCKARFPPLGCARCDFNACGLFVHHLSTHTSQPPPLHPVLAWSILDVSPFPLPPHPPITNKQTTAVSFPGCGGLAPWCGVWGGGQLMIASVICPRGEPGYRDRITMVSNALFTRDSAGKLHMTVDAPIFREVQSRMQRSWMNQFHEGHSYTTAIPRTP